MVSVAAAANIHDVSGFASYLACYGKLLACAIGFQQ